MHLYFILFFSDKYSMSHSDIWSSNKTYPEKGKDRQEERTKSGKKTFFLKYVSVHVLPPVGGVLKQATCYTMSAKQRQLNRKQCFKTMITHSSGLETIYQRTTIYFLHFYVHASWLMCSYNKVQEQAYGNYMILTWILMPNWPFFALQLKGRFQYNCLDLSWEYINRLQIHKCRYRERGRAVSFPGNICFEFSV
jgi:hypothetical protein